MALRPTFKIDFTEWDRTIGPYMASSHRGRADVLNKKAYYISRRALYETPATPKKVITSSLGQIRRSKKQIVSMKLTPGRDNTAPLAALIINSRMAKEGRKGLYGKAMEAAIASFISARAKSRAFLKSGWIPAVKALEHSFTGSRGGLPPSDRTAKQYGQAHGRAVPAESGVKCQVLIENSADLENFKTPIHVETSHKDALIRYGGPALQRAFDLEAASMAQEVMRRQHEAAKEAGIRIAEFIA